MSITLSPAQQLERDRTLQAFEGGGSVMVGGRIITRRQDLPDDHPARWEEDEPAPVSQQLDDAATLARIAELESWIKQRDATITALNASQDQAQKALDASNEERAKLQDALDAAQKALAAKDSAASPVPEKPADKPNTPQAGEVQPPAATLATDTVTPPTAPETGQAAPSTATPLPIDFPKADALRAAGFDTIESVRALAPDQLATVNGIGPAAIQAINDYLAK